MLIFSREFLIAALERAVKTAAQTVVAFIVAAQVEDAFSVDWASALGVAALGFVLSALTSLASAGVGPDDTPSLTQDR